MVCRAITAGQTRTAWERVEELTGIFPDRFYLELQRHGIGAQDRVNAELSKMAVDLGLPLLATNDAHYLEQGDHRHHDALLCIGTGTKLDDPKRFRFDGDGFYLKSGDEMAELFHDHPSAVRNTLEMAERCTFELDLDSGSYQLPEFQVPVGHHARARARGADPARAAPAPGPRAGRADPAASRRVREARRERARA